MKTGGIMKHYFWRRAYAMKEIDTIYEMQKKYGYIKSINLFREISGEECGKYNLELSLVNFPCWDIEEHLNIIFEGVSNLTLGNIDNLLKVFIKIDSIAEWQHEDTRYAVKECENDLFAFRCKHLKIVLNQYSVSIESMSSIDNWMWENEKKIDSFKQFETILDARHIVVIKLKRPLVKDMGIFLKKWKIIISMKCGLIQKGIQC